ncbi:hypothetical protein FIBSPDRAFT_1035984 [Athelia psychrophila]|uniref:Uncharacterized protein n=1 Tax=Athelia psychrophila TaxID=1759441 RepID=A0A166W5L8_9AGAM|nr:hypothetical protein FIBSPDRAFT_1035984 [Fibularhizoctonia sp. CBS 109695]
MTDASTRILIVSASQAQAISFAERVKTEGGTASPPPADLSDGKNIIPWKISNKYYSAEVQFSAHEVKAWSALLADGVPAVIFVWACGEPYKEHLQYLAKELEDHDPEVSLAVRMEGSSPKEGSEDDEDVDAFLSTLGFEFVDATTRAAEAHDIDAMSHGESRRVLIAVPGLPRVIDALSTIMWPTMVQSQSTTARKSRARELLDWVRDEEEDDGLRPLVNPSDEAGAVTTSSSSLADNGIKSRMQREMEELERWLEDEEGLRATQDPWIVPSNEKSLEDPLSTTDSPLDLHHRPEGSISSWAYHTGEASASSGFDDDFTVFVSAPPAEPSAPQPITDVPSGRSTPDTDMLNPMHTGASYRSLGSVSDFGGNTSAEEHQGDDEGLPSEDEIRATSARIFGSSLSPSLLPPQALPPTGAPRATSPPQATPTAASFPTSATFFPESEDEEYDMGEFDLSRVLNALQAMKEEISGMGDEDARRKAAARAAMGLVYGLERQDSEHGSI